jgi:hypothetical protein
MSDHPPTPEQVTEHPGLRHTGAKKNATGQADSLDHIPLRYLLAFTGVVIATSRDYLAARAGSVPGQRHTRTHTISRMRESRHAR